MTRRFQTVRIRATIGATLIVAIALVLAGILLVSVLRRTQLDTIDSSLELRARDIEGLIDGGASLSTVAVQSDEDGFIQIVDSTGAVVASSENLGGEIPVSERPASWMGTEQLAEFDGASFRIGVFETDGAVARTIIVGSALDDAEQIAGVMIGALVIGLPLLLLLIASLVWVVVGRALRPVESMRRQVDEIGGGDLHRRIPEPEVHDEIGRLATTMNGMLDRLERANLAQSQFVSDASHELRTPIAVIRHELEIALRHDDSSDWRRTAEEVLDENLRMQRLVDDLLFLARRDGPGTAPPLASQLVDLDDVVLSEAHRVHTTRIVDTSAVSAGQVRGDADHLGRIVRNLLDNALRHCDSTVAISVTSEDGRVEMSVDDDGAGIAPTDREHIFERFGRVDEARDRRDGGSGLGLSIVSDLVADNGGTIAVSDSERFGGARFTVAFPDARS